MPECRRNVLWAQRAVFLIGRLTVYGEVSQFLVHFVASDSPQVITGCVEEVPFKLPARRLNTSRFPRSEDRVDFEQGDILNWRFALPSASTDVLLVVRLFVAFEGIP